MVIFKESLSSKRMRVTDFVFKLMLSKESLGRMALVKVNYSKSSFSTLTERSLEPCKVIKLMRVALQCFNTGLTSSIKDI